MKIKRYFDYNILLLLLLLLVNVRFYRNRANKGNKNPMTNYGFVTVRMLQITVRFIGE